MNKLSISIIVIIIMSLISLNSVEAGVNIHIGIGLPIAPAPVVVTEPAPYAPETVYREPARYAPPPVYEDPEPPAMVVIPGTYVYSVADPRYDIFFYHGSWWRRDHGRWFAARDYNRSWVFVRPENVPGPVIHVPGDYRYRMRGSEHIDRRDLRANWDRWEREKHWDRHDEHRDYGDRHDHEDRHDHGDWHDEEGH